MVRLSEQHIEQAKSMKADGKSVNEIVEFLNKTYSLSAKPFHIYAALKGVAAAPKVKRAYTRKAKPVETPAPDNIIKEIVGLLSEIQNGYKKVFKHLRKELMRSRAEVCEMIAGAGIKDDDNDA